MPDKNFEIDSCTRRRRKNQFLRHFLRKNSKICQKTNEIQNAIQQSLLNFSKKSHFEALKDETRNIKNLTYRPSWHNQL